MLTIRTHTLVFAVTLHNFSWRLVYSTVIWLLGADIHCMSNANKYKWSCHQTPFTVDVYPIKQQPLLMKNLFNVCQAQMNR